MKTFDDVYLQILKDLWNSGTTVSPRGMKVKELLAYKFTLEDPRNNIINLPGFKTNVDYGSAELEWYYSGSNRIDFNPIIEKTWKQFSDDGVHVNSSYGFQIFGKHPEIKVNQWEWIKKKLKEDSDSRQCVININLPSYKEKDTKDFVCTMDLQVFIRDNKLHWITHLRSQDIYFGTRNDVYCFTMMQQKLAKELNVGLGKYHHFCGSMHIYERHFDNVKTLLNSLYGIQGTQ